MSQRHAQRRRPEPALSRTANVATALSGAALLATVCGPLVHRGFSFAVPGMHAAV